MELIEREAQSAEQTVVHGYWEQGDMYDYGDVCSVCGYDSAREPCTLRECPHCGARMNGGEGYEAD